MATAVPTGGKGKGERRERRWYPSASRGFGLVEVGTALLFRTLVTGRRGQQRRDAGYLVTSGGSWDGLEVASRTVPYVDRRFMLSLAFFCRGQLMKVKGWSSSYES